MHRLACKLLFTLFLASFLGAPTRAHAEDDARYSPAYRDLLEQANQAFRKEDYTEVLALLSRADKMIPNTALALNLRGAVATNQKDFDAAREFFNRAITKSGDYFPAKFNLGELFFLERKYPEAREQFEKMLEVDPKNELLIYKIFMTYLMEENGAKAAEWKEKITFPSDTPSYYFVRAAEAFKGGDPDSARKWVAESLRVFPPLKNEYYVESLSDMGWISKGPGN